MNRYVLAGAREFSSSTRARTLRRVGVRARCLWCVCVCVCACVYRVVYAGVCVRA